MARRPRVYDREPFRSADPRIAGFADYLGARNASRATVVAYQRDLESFGSFLNATAARHGSARASQRPVPGLAAATAARRLLPTRRTCCATRAYSPKSIRRKLSALRTFYGYLK